MMDYYEKLEQSNLFKGKVVAINLNDEIAKAGDYIKHLKCLKCKTLIFSGYRADRNTGLIVETCNVNCPKCKWDSIKRKHGL